MNCICGNTPTGHRRLQQTTARRRSMAKEGEGKKVSNQFKAESMGESEQRGSKTGANSPVWVVQVLCDDRDSIKRD